MKLWLFPILERWCLAVEALAGYAAQRLAICPACGGNRYEAPPCLVVPLLKRAPWDPDVVMEHERRSR